MAACGAGTKAQSRGRLAYQLAVERAQRRYKRAISRDFSARIARLKVAEQGAMRQFETRQVVAVAAEISRLQASKRPGNAYANYLMRMKPVRPSAIVRAAATAYHRQVQIARTAYHTSVWSAAARQLSCVKRSEKQAMRAGRARLVVVLHRYAHKILRRQWRDRYAVFLSKQRWINLMPAIHLIRGVKRPNWVLAGHVLKAVSVTSRNHRVGFRNVLGITKNYEIRVKFMRMSGTQCVALIAPVGRCAFNATVSGYPTPANGSSPEGISGLEDINGKNLLSNATRTPAGVISNRRVHTFDLRVRVRKRAATISAYFDRDPYFRWHGPETALSLNPWWSLPSGMGPFGLGTYSSPIIFLSVQIRRLPARTARRRG